MSKNDVAWKRYFDHTDALAQIEQNGFVLVRADELKAIARREPRLLAKQDTLSTRPQIFRQEKLAILPVKNGIYILFRDPDNHSFYQLAAHETDLPTEIYHSTVDLHSFDAYPGGQSLNESQALDFAHVSSLLKTFTGAESLHLVIRSRIFSGDFHFQLPENAMAVDVSSVQIEIDAGYESHDTIFLFEAKVGKREDFNIRQLYYPYLEWSRRSSKRIVPIFLIYSNAHYYLYQFAFSSRFGDIRLVRKNRYVVNESPHPDVTIPDLLAFIPVESEPVGVPYPQANDLDKVVDLVGLIGQGVNNKVEIAEYFEFDERQADYYANAACYLGFLERKENAFRLTDGGTSLLAARSLARRNLIVISQMIQRPSLRQSIELLRDKEMALHAVTNAEIATLIAQNTTLAGTTLPRRASTVKRWLAWVVETLGLEDPRQLRMYPDQQF